MDHESFNAGRRKLLRNSLLVATGTMFGLNPLSAKTTEQEMAPGDTVLKKTNEQFENGEHVYSVEYQGGRVGEFWPIKLMHLVTKTTNPAIFQQGLTDVVTELEGAGMLPDGMTKAAQGYKLQGRAISRGRETGDGTLPDYGLVIMDARGRVVKFTHKREYSSEADLQTELDNVKKTGGSAFFAPSMLRRDPGTGKILKLENNTMIDKVLIRRDTVSGPQIGAVVFDKLTSYAEAIAICQGMDRLGKSETTHVFVLDGGPSWGASVKRTHNAADSSSPFTATELGTRDPNVVTNYLMLF